MLRKSIYKGNNNRNITEIANGYFINMPVMGEIAIKGLDAGAQFGKMFISKKDGKIFIGANNRS